MVPERDVGETTLRGGLDILRLDEKQQCTGVESDWGTHYYQRTSILIGDKWTGYYGCINGVSLKTERDPCS